MIEKIGKTSKETTERPPDVRTATEREGFAGALYRPDRDRCPGKALVLVGGLDGLFSLTERMAELFADQGMTALAVACWNVEGLPAELSHVPLETGRQAGQWLQQQGYRKIGIWGISAGAVFALLCGSLLPELYTCVAAISPLCVCPQGFRKKNRESKTELLEGSAFCFRGEDIPWAPLRFSRGRVWLDCLRRREPSLRFCCGDVLETAPEEAWIPVERISGPVLLAAAEQDSVWPSRESAEAMARRLQERGFCHPVAYLHYPDASHFLLPCRLNVRKLFRLERYRPENCARSSQDAFEKTLTFLRENW